MFGNKKSNESPTSSNSYSPNSINSLAKGTSVKGDISAENDFRIDGKLEGNLNSKGRLIIGGSGDVRGEVMCQNAVIEGVFDGVLKVTDLLVVKESARVTGNITVGNVNVESGAVFNVSCNTGAAVKKIVSDPKMKLAN